MDTNQYAKNCFIDMDFNSWFFSVLIPLFFLYLLNSFSIYKMVSEVKQMGWPLKWKFCSD